MARDAFTILIDGEELPELYADLDQLEVELDDELAGQFRLRLRMERREASFSHIDDPRLSPWKRVDIEGGLENGAEPLITGYLTQLRPRFGASDSGMFLELWGMDASVLLDRVEVQKAWPNKKDSDIASEVFASYGLTPDVENTELVHDEAQSTVLQRETDMQFLKRLALRNGYECYVKGDTGVFRPPAYDAEPKPVLAAHFGAETTISNVAITLDAAAPVDVALAQVGRMDKQVHAAVVAASEVPSFGAAPSSALLAAGMPFASRVIGWSGALGATEMERMARGLRDRADFFVEVQGDVDGLAYGHVLLPRDTVYLKGIGETYSGLYYVTRVTHVFAAGGYTQRVQLRRNALQLLGDEQFDGAGAGLGGLL